MYKVQDLLPFEIWLFQNGQLDCDNDLIICEARGLTYEQRSLVWVSFASAAEICLKNHCDIGKVKTSCLS